MNKKNDLLSRLPQKLRRELANPPKAGGGVHRWLFTMSLRLVSKLTRSQIQTVLAEALIDCGRPVSCREIDEAICAAGKWKGSSSQPGSGCSRKGRSKWPPVNKIAQEEAFLNEFTTGMLSVISPVWVEKETPNAKEFLEMLFEPESLLCVGRSPRVFETVSLENLLKSDLASTELIVPSPMSASHGLTQAGRKSARSNANTGPRRYLVTEFDSSTPDEQARIIWHLNTYAPLLMVLSSGGKSLHAWWPCTSEDEAVILRFFKYAVSLGADPATWSKSQFVRLPQGWRSDKNARQQVMFFDRRVLPKSGGQHE